MAFPVMCRVCLQVERSQRNCFKVPLYALKHCEAGFCTAYHTSACFFPSDQVDAVKRNCIKVLPHTLVVHLKRFEFDYETMNRWKIKDRFEFPLRLDMHPYTVDGLAEADAAASAKARLSHTAQDIVTQSLSYVLNTHLDTANALAKSDAVRLLQGAGIFTENDLRHNQLV